MLMFLLLFLPPTTGVYVRDFQPYHECETAIAVKHERGNYYSVNWITKEKDKVTIKSGRARYTGLGLMVSYQRSEVEYHYVFMPRGTSRVPYCIELK
jgi:hypothetical protein